MYYILTIAVIAISAWKTLSNNTKADAAMRYFMVWYFSCVALVVQLMMDFLTDWGKQ